jgi:glycosyltransferase involved in cell wall biosynthesis
VDAFIALSRHQRDKLLAGGLPAERVKVKPNFLPDPGPPLRRSSEFQTVVFAGRLAPEKGVKTLLEAWRNARLGGRAKLLIAGDGPQRAELEGLVSPGVTLLGRRSPAEVRELLAGARCAVLPSLWYEGCPMAAIEPFALGRPVIASDLGTLAEIIHPGQTGLLARPGDVSSWSQALQTMLASDDLADRMGANARAEYLARYTPERNFRELMEIYRFAIERRGGRMPQRLEEEQWTTSVQAGSSW